MKSFSYTQWDAWATHCCVRNCGERIVDLPPVLVTTEGSGEIPAFHCAEHRAEALACANVRESNWTPHQP